MLVTLAIATAGLLAVLVARSAMKLSRSHSNDSGDFVPGGFQVDRYRPMERLLLAEELKTLEAQPGYTDAIGKEWMRARRKIFRLYLNELKKDFAGLHLAARAAVAASGEESHELVGVLIRQQLVFWAAITMVEIRFAWAGMGFRPVDVRPLLATLDGFRLDLERFAPEAA